MNTKPLLSLVCAGLILLAHPVRASAADANSSPGPTLRITNTRDAAQLEFDATHSGLPQTITLGDVQVPGQVFVLAIQDEARFQSAISAAETAAVSEAWKEPLQLAAPHRGVDSEGNPFERLPTGKLPESPLVILRYGIFRGQRLATVAMTQLYQTQGQTRRVRRLSLALDGATLIDDATALATQFEQAPADANAVPTPAQNAQAGAAARIARVSKTGLQRLTPAALSTAGLSANSVCVYFNGTALPIHEPGDGSAIFYAGSAGDRYNSSTAYWIVSGGCPRMGAAPQGAAGAPGEAAYEIGSWKQDALYYNIQPGPGGDHWYSKQVDVTSQANMVWALQAPGSVLPGASGTAVFTITGVTATSAAYAGSLTGNGVSAVAAWNGDGLFAVRFTHAGGAMPLQFNLTGGTRIYADGFAWRRPVALNFAGGGAVFHTARAGTYQINNAGTRTIYDISNPLQPGIVAGAGNDRALNLVAGGTYIAGGDTNTQTDHNSLESYAPINASSGRLPNTALNRTAYYIAPLSLRDHPKLAELINLRNSQGWSTEVIPVESLYAFWGYGQVDPEAIRRFLQHQFNVSSAKPQAVVLVGDGDYDWRGREDASSTPPKVYPRLIPPYLADVDHYNITTSISNPPPAETACDPCYAQLDGISALDDMIPDLMFGRLPVNGPEQLATVVDKIVRYETLTTDLSDGSWRSRIGYLVDNYWRAPDGQNIVPGQPLPPNPVTDPAGPFWDFADTNINTIQPIGPSIVRKYYDPYGRIGAGYGLPAPQPGNNIPALAGKSMFNDGAAFVTYIGHSNEVRMGQFETSDYYDDGFLYDFQVKNLTNVDKLPVVLQMTCKTGSFHKHNSAANSDVDKETYLDERLVLQPGNTGAIAVWSSTGLGVMYGHQPLLHGFFKTYWKTYSVNAPPTIGSAAMGGYLQLFAENQANGEDSLRTYSILGDPLTRGRVHVSRLLLRDQIASAIRLPIVTR